MKSSPKQLKTMRRWYRRKSQDSTWLEKRRAAARAYKLRKKLEGVA